MADKTLQREIEQARGREIAARHAAEIAPQKTLEEKNELLARYREIRDHYWVASLKAARFTIEPDEHGNNIAWLDGERVAGERRGPAFPSDMFVAQCALAVNALVNPADVPDYSAARRLQIEERERRNAYRNSTTSQWKQLYDNKK